MVSDPETLKARAARYRERAADLRLRADRMPEGQGQRRPADVIGAAVKVMRIATGEETEDTPPAKRAAAELSAKGGGARAKSLTRVKRRAIARKGTLALA